MPEYAKEGWSVLQEQSQPQMNAGRVWWRTPSVDAVYGVMQAAYDTIPQRRAVMGSKARDRALDHDPHTVMPLWLKALEEVQERLEAARGVTTVAIPDVLKQAVTA
jgi:hypothetical protein